MESVAVRSCSAREARPGRRLRAVLLEGDPLRRQERQHRERDDDDRGRQPDED